MVNSAEFTGTVAGGSVDTTLALTMPATTAMFAPFTPGQAKEYLVTAALTTTSTGGDAALSVYDAATTGTGRLVNGTATLTNPLQVFASATQGTAGVGGAVGGAAAPTQLLTFAAPQTNRATTLTFRQNIAAAETLRAGTYGKTLTFTLSTTAP
jgi:hypothetical protein